jgi:hypothetical protein
MIAEILLPFKNDTLTHKISYQLAKIEEGNAKELYNSSGDSLSNMYPNMLLVSALNDRIKSPFIEFVLSSPVGEDLSNDKFLEVAKEYLCAMGYADSCYTIIKHDDKENSHIHILATTLDVSGNRISDQYSKVRSGKIMRELEIKHGLERMEKGRSSYNKTLGESQYRQYFFDTALHKALRSYNMKERIKEMLDASENFKAVNPDMSKSYTNDEWKIMLGEDSYTKILAVLSNARFFNPLYKDELLSAMDRLYQGCSTMKEFRDKLEKEGYYCRLVSDKGKSHYVYGIPERGFYLKDTGLPERYRFGKIAFVGNKMTPDEQKHYLYNKIFAILKESSGYEDFKEKLAENDIKLIEHINRKGVYGISFVMMNVDAPEIFKSSDISRRLTYRNIQNYFSKEQEPEVKQEQERKEKCRRNELDINPVIVCYANNRQEWEKDMNYMYPAAMAIGGIALESSGRQRKSDDDELPGKKKKKKRRNKGLSI